MIDTIIHGDCLKVMPSIADKSIDMILCDLPYGTTSCAWDTIIAFEPLWQQYKRVCKDNAAIVLFGSQPFTSKLIMSNLDMFKYALVWNKNKCGSPGLAKRRPLKTHEDILIFSKGVETYNAQMEKGEAYIRHPTGKCRTNGHGFGFSHNTKTYINDGTRYPKSILNISRDFSAQQQIHPTQKPVPLCKYLISTYTNVGELVLDNACGSGSTCVAAKQLGRHFIGIEKYKKYVNIAGRAL